MIKFIIAYAVLTLIISWSTMVYVNCDEDVYDKEDLVIAMTLFWPIILPLGGAALIVAAIFDGLQKSAQYVATKIKNKR